MDLDECEGDVNELGVELTQGQFDALTSFTFNCGGGASIWEAAGILKNSDLTGFQHRRFRDGDDDDGKNDARKGDGEGLEHGTRQ